MVVILLAAFDIIQVFEKAATICLHLSS